MVGRVIAPSTALSLYRNLPTWISRAAMAEPRDPFCRCGQRILGHFQVAQGQASPLRFYQFTNPTEAVGFFANRNHFAALIYSVVLLTAAWAIHAWRRGGSAFKRKDFNAASILAALGWFYASRGAPCCASYGALPCWHGSHYGCSAWGIFASLRGRVKRRRISQQAACSSSELSLSHSLFIVAAFSLPHP